MTEKEIIQKIYEVIKLVDCMQYNPLVDFNYLRAKGAYNIIKNQVEHIEAENAELKSSLTHANEECLKWHERAQNLLKDSGGSISGYEKKISDLQAKNAELRHRAEVAERAFSKLVHEMYEHGIRPMCDEKFFLESRLKDAEKELAEGKKG